MNKESSKEILSNMSFCVFDLETTGGDHKSDKIIEIGLVKIQGLKIVGRPDRRRRQILWRHSPVQVR